MLWIQDTLIHVAIQALQAQLIPLFFPHQQANKEEGNFSYLNARTDDDWLLCLIEQANCLKNFNFWTSIAEHKQILGVKQHSNFWQENKMKMQNLKRNLFAIKDKAIKAWT